MNNNKAPRQAVQAPYDVRGVIVPLPDQEAKDPSTGQCISVIKTGSNPYHNMPSLAPNAKTFPKESQAQEVDEDESRESAKEEAQEAE